MAFEGSIALEFQAAEGAFEFATAYPVDSGVLVSFERVLMRETPATQVAFQRLLFGVRCGMPPKGPEIPELHVAHIALEWKAVRVNVVDVPTQLARFHKGQRANEAFVQAPLIMHVAVVSGELPVGVETDRGTANVAFVRTQLGVNIRMVEGGHSSHKWLVT